MNLLYQVIQRPLSIPQEESTLGCLTNLVGGIQVQMNRVGFSFPILEERNHEDLAFRESPDGIQLVLGNARVFGFVGHGIHETEFHDPIPASFGRLHLL